MSDGSDVPAPDQRLVTGDKQATGGDGLNIGKQSRWQPGQSGNPNGRPKRKPITDALLAELAKPAAKRGPKAQQTKLEAAAARMLSIVLTAKPTEAVAAFRAMAAYTQGLPTQPLELNFGQALDDIAARTGAPKDWLLQRAEEIAAQASKIPFTEQ